MGCTLSCTCPEGCWYKSRRQEPLLWTPGQLCRSLQGWPLPCRAPAVVPDSACMQVWVKPSAEMQFLYGNHVLKSGLGRITEATPAYTGVRLQSWCC